MCPSPEPKPDTLATVLLVWGYVTAIQHSCKVHRRTGGPGVRRVRGREGLRRLNPVQMCRVARTSVARWPMSRGSSVCFLCKPIVTMLETIHTHHRAVQTISTPSLLHIRSFTNSFCGMYRDRNHRQLWRLVQGMCLGAGNFGGFGIHRCSDSQQKLAIGSVNTNTIPFYKANINNNNNNNNNVLKII